MSIERPLVPEEGDSTDSKKLAQELKDKLHKGEISDPERLKKAIGHGFYSVEDMEAVQNVINEIVTMKHELVSLLNDAENKQAENFFLETGSRRGLILESLRGAGGIYNKRFDNLKDLLEKSVNQRLDHYKKEKDGK